MRPNIDPVTLEVVCEGLSAIVREMRATVIRTGFSAAIYELDDFSCAIFDPSGQMVAQSNDHPGHVMPMPWTVRAAMEDFGGDLAPGDVILVNDPYRGGTHLNDVSLLVPTFHDGELILFPAMRAHWADVGGMTPGSYSGEATSIFQEGVRIPPVKLYEGGRLVQGVQTLLLANMRLPDERLGDLNAGLGACRIASQRILKLVEKFGRDVVMNAIAANLDRTEARMRERIARLPDGEYAYEDYLELFDAGRFDPVLMRLNLVKRGDEIIADFEGSSPQAPGVVNASLATVGAGVFVAIKSTLDPEGPINHGAFRPIQLKAPPGSIVDVRGDAPAGAHGEVRKRAVSVMLGALSQVIPDLVSGDLSGTSFPNNMGGRDAKRNRPYVYIEIPAGGNGGFLENDGSSTFVNVDFGNIRSIYNVEALELAMPIRVVGCDQRTDSGGEGRMRGGLGMRREIRPLDGGDAVYSVLSDRAVIPPFGVLGGGSGAAVRVTVNNGGEERDLPNPGKCSGRRIRDGETIVMRSAGGGGYGDPLERDPERVRGDVAAGYVSPERARDGYGVVLIGEGDVDVEATELRRRELRAARPTLAVHEDEAPAYGGHRGKHRVLRLSPAAAERCAAGDGDLVELLGGHPAPLRAWVRLDREAPPDAVGLDAFARKVLAVAAGDRVTVRRLPMPPIAGGMAP